ncbi:DNA-directed RNA polymerase I subunit RPA12-like protein [Cinnamomum micranthum f. kanehirae]|uniref:DNA-directed RNA polymerase I subunit RPA12-like protein n=1 Tax=Cinnamomum micranthum f. kanehirae TaxID=337451 RepID=A0A443NM75_9MAGN|nr:DNA-directed RNA polymerase I subunit RPA12-like protein [Cinnamomum micranthum f. kanehirae]
MTSSHGYDLLFCDICGTMLSLDSPNYAKCPRCQLKQDVKDLKIEEQARDIRRELNLEPFVQLDKTSIEEAGMQRAVLRSADEGQTVFYECPKCRHKFSINT